MKIILFVDDQQNVLDGLRRMLHSMRNEWEMHFATSGEKALELLAGAPFDVIVSDMRMPGMDGAQLLNEVKARYPDAVRMILSGQSDDETILRSVEPAHQYLSKPCDADTLKATIGRACALRDFLGNEPLKRLLSQVGALPSAPSLYVQLINELKSPDSSIQRVAKIIIEDVGMTAKILQLVNSAFFGISCRISSIQQAVSIIGLKTIKTLILSIQVFSQIDQSKLKGFHIEAMMDHSVAVGIYARKIAQTEKLTQEICDAAFSAGMLHDVGKLVLADNFTDKYANVLNSIADNGTTLWKAEQETFYASHAAIGAYLMGIWGLPDHVVEAIAFHHQPQDCVHRDFCPLTAVHAADALQHDMNSGENNTPDLQIDTEYLKALGLLDKLDDWREACLETTQKKEPA